MTRLIDSHCHLNYDFSPKSTDDLIGEARAAGVDTLITIGTDLESIEKCQDLSDRYPGIFHSVGVHPHEVAALTEQDSYLSTLETATAHPKCRAIGEIGLDYHYDHSPRDVQLKRLKEQLLLAARLRFPVVIHSREAEADLLAALTEYIHSLEKGTLPGAIHCFSGTQTFGQACLGLGFYISFSGIITFKNAEAIRESARTCPLDRILVETDAPYLAPAPHRGKKCEPAMVRSTAMKLAEIKGLTFDEIATATTQNARRLFRLP